MSIAAQPLERSLLHPPPWDGTPTGAAWERELAAAALHFAESLELPVVLDRVAQRVAALFGGVCQVRFAPAHRLKKARRATAETTSEPAPWGTGGAGETDASMLTWQEEQSPSRASPSSAGLPAARQHGTSPASGEDTASEALLLVPLVARGRRIGAIDVVIHAPFGYDMSAGQRRLRALAAYAALAIDSADQLAQLRPPSAEAADKTEADEHGALLATIVHDLRSPLATLSSSIQLLARAARGAQELEADKVTRLVEIAEAAIGQLEAQVGTLTPASATRRSVGDRPGTPLDLITLVRLMANFYQQTTSRHRLLVAAEVMELAGPWSRGHLERVVGNLLANAIKYSPAGGEIQIAVAREEEELGSWATLSVRNHGIGIPAADMGQLSQPGYRAGNVGAIPGTGFGLASVREVVEQYGGTCAIQSASRGTTVVRVRLPLSGGAQG